MPLGRPTPQTPLVVFHRQFAFYFVASNSPQNDDEQRICKLVGLGTQLTVL